VKRPQWIALLSGLALFAAIFFWGRTVPQKKKSPVETVNQESITTDSILIQAKKQLTVDQVMRLNSLEQSVKRGDIKDQQLKVYHQLAHFWADSARIFEPFAWYEAESARLENSEKNLTFAAHLFLQNLRGESNPALRTWKALQAKDLFERSLKLNPANDSSTVGLGACYIFGSITDMPMEGIMKVRQVAERDSTNIFAQEILGHGAMITGQYDKAINRFETVYRLASHNNYLQMQAALLLGEIYERLSNKTIAVSWYERSLPLTTNEDIRSEIQKRIKELKK
jgi:tetratricopeptide (TPR) repeat protein